MSTVIHCGLHIARSQLLFNSHPSFRTLSCDRPMTSLNESIMECFLSVERRGILISASQDSAAWKAKSTVSWMQEKKDHTTTQIMTIFYIALLMSEEQNCGDPKLEIP